METFKYHPHNHQKKFHSSNKRIRALIAGRGGGKTLAGAVEAYIYAQKNPKSLVLAIAESYPVLRDVMHPELEKIITATGIGTYKVGDRTFTLKENDSRIQLISADNPDTLRGRGPDAVWCDEARNLDLKTWRIIYTIATRGKKAPIWITSTPNGRDWMYEEVIQRADTDDNYDVIFFKSIDNPHLDPESIEDAKKTLSDAFFRQEYEASIVQQEGVIYEDFSRGTHVVNDLPEFVRFVGGVDFGFKNPFCFLLAGITADNELYIIGEHYQAGLTTQAHSQAIQGLIGERTLETIFADPSGKQLIEDFKNQQLYMQGGNNDVLAGIHAVTARIRTEKLFIHKTCVNLIAELEGYVWQPERGGIQKDQPVKINDHSVDALRYLIMGLDTGPEISLRFI